MSPDLQSAVTAAVFSIGLTSGMVVILLFAIWFGQRGRR